MTDELRARLVALNENSRDLLVVAARELFHLALLAEEIVLAVPFGDVRSVLEECGDLTGKIIIDCTNPLTADFRDLTMGFSISGGEMVASLAKGPNVFKTLNQRALPTRLTPHFPTVGR